MTEDKTPRKPARLKLIIFSLLPAVLLFAAANFGSYLVIHRAPETRVDSLTGLPYYTMKIGRLPWSPRSTTPLNSLGFPDDEFTAEPKGECVHILFTGDSFTFGDAVDRDRNWVSLVERMTRARYPERCIRYFNIAERMTTIEQQARRVRQVLPILDPDLVIIGQYQNDLTDLTMPGSIAYHPEEPGKETNFWGDVLRTSIPGYTNSLVRFLTYRTFAFLIRHDIEYDVLASWSVLADTTHRPETARELTRVYRDLFADLVAELRAKDIDVGVVTMPSKLDVMAKRYPEGQYFARIAREMEIPILETMPALAATRDRYAFQMYDGHLSEYGNAVVARAVADWLFASPAPFAALSGSVEGEALKAQSANANLRHGAVASGPLQTAHR